MGGCDPLGGHGEDEGAGDEGDGGRTWRVTGVVPCPAVALPSSLACERTGSMGGDRGRGAGRRLGTCPAGPAQSGFVVAGGDSTGHSARPSTSSVCTGTGALGAQRAAARGRAPSAILLTPLAASGHAGPQGRGKGGLMGSGFLWVVPERKNLHPLRRHLLPALSFAAQTGLFQSLCFPALGNNNLWPLFFFSISQSKSLF